MEIPVFLYISSIMVGGVVGAIWATLYMIKDTRQDLARRKLGHYMVNKATGERSFDYNDAYFHGISNLIDMNYKRLKELSRIESIDEKQKKTQEFLLDLRKEFEYRGGQLIDIGFHNVDLEKYDW